MGMGWEWGGGRIYVPVLPVEVVAPRPQGPPTHPPRAPHPPPSPPVSHIEHSLGGGLESRGRQAGALGGARRPGAAKGHAVQRFDGQHRPRRAQGWQGPVAGQAQQKCNIHQAQDGGDAQGGQHAAGKEKDGCLDDACHRQGQAHQRLRRAQLVQKHKQPGVDGAHGVAKHQASAEKGACRRRRKHERQLARQRQGRRGGGGGGGGTGAG